MPASMTFVEAFKASRRYTSRFLPALYREKTVHRIVFVELDHWERAVLVVKTNGDSYLLSDSNEWRWWKCLRGARLRKSEGWNNVDDTLWKVVIANFDRSAYVPCGDELVIEAWATLGAYISFLRDQGDNKLNGIEQIGYYPD
jgi:hypothetical protein